MTSKPTEAQRAVLAVLETATRPLRRPEIGKALGLGYPPDHRTLTACSNRGWVTGDFPTGWQITDSGRAAIAEEAPNPYHGVPVEELTEMQWAMG